MVKFLWYSVIVSLIIDFITVIAPILLLLEKHINSSFFMRIMAKLFVWTIVLYLPFAFILIWPALLFSVFSIAYASVQIIRDIEGNSYRLLVVAILSLMLGLIALYFRSLLS